MKSVPDLHGAIGPLHLLGDVECCMNDELIESRAFWWEFGEAVAAGLGRAKLIFEEWLIFGAYYSEVVRHDMLCRELRRKSTVNVLQERRRLRSCIR